MITPKIKALFQFIEYLHSNIDNFNLNNDLIKELEQLDEERQKVSSKKTFKEKLKYDEVQAEIETKFKILQGNTANLIKAKAKELNVCNFDNEPNYSFNGIETDIRQLKENFSKNDLPVIFKHKQQYIEYRKKTHQTFLSLELFVDKLDEITKSLFDYFKETEQNDFEAFETKAIPVNSIVEAIQGFKKGQTKFTLSNNFLLNTSTIQQQPNIEPLPPQPIVKQKPIKYGAKEYALTYIFDLYATGKQVPINRIEGSFDAKKIKQDVSKFPMYDKAPDTFYRAVKSVLEYDLNKPTDLQNISKDWLNAVRNLSTNWVITERYLKDKNLIGE
jgi:hypothetical protein